jgi:hypothetical protein
MPIPLISFLMPFSALAHYYAISFSFRHYAISRLPFYAVFIIAISIMILRHIAIDFRFRQLFTFIY